MRLLKLALLVVGFVLVSTGVANAQESWRTGPSLTGATTPDPLCTRGIGPGATCYWTFNNSTVDSPVIHISAEYATLSFNANIAAETFVNTMELRRVIGTACTGSSTTTATNNNSEPIHNGTTELLDGDGDSQQAFIFEVPTGCYFINPVTGGAIDSVVSLTGAPVGRQ